MKVKDLRDALSSLSAMCDEFPVRVFLGIKDEEPVTVGLDESNWWIEGTRAETSTLQFTAEPCREDL
jgi:hypothetical protein